MATFIDRRSLLKRGVGLGALALGGGAFLAACGSSSSSGSTSPSSNGSSTAASLGVLTFRLDWLENVEFAGELIADSSGYFTDEGFSSVSFIAGGPSATPAEADVVQGKAIIGLSAPAITGAAVAQGAPLKILAATYQKNPYCVVYLKSKPVPNPQAMIGKTVAVAAASESSWQAFLKSVRISASSVKTVPLGTDPLILTTGECDAMFAFVTNQPIAVEDKGFDVGYFLTADYGYNYVMQTFMATQDTITSKRDVLKAALRADLRGWKDSLNDPTKGAQLAVTKYGANLGLDLEQQVQTSVAQNALILTPSSRANGLFSISPALLSQTMQTLTESGIKVTQNQLFDTSIINEIHSEDPSLMTGGLPANLITPSPIPS